MFTIKRFEIPGFDGVALALTGKADLLASEQLERGLTFALADSPQRAIIECSHLEFIGSFGIGQLVLFRKSMNQHAGRVALVGVRPEIHQALKYSRLEDLFTILPSVADAQAALT